jgi:uncharacterized protein (TIGR02596 family)
MNRRRKSSAFSLIELLVVIAIIGILAGLAIPAFHNITAGNSLSATAESVQAALAFARQTALTRNRAVEVRFYKLPETASPSGAPADYRGLQLFSIDTTSTNALGRPVYFSGPVIVSSNAATASLMNDTLLPETAPAATDPSLGALGKNYRYRKFRFRPDGSTDLSATGSWFLSLVPKNAPASRPQDLPANFITLQIDPLNGRTMTFQP